MGPRSRSVSPLHVILLVATLLVPAPVRAEENGRALIRHIRAHPDDLTARYRLGKLCFRRGAYDKALRLWSELLRRRPRSVTLLKGIGMAHYKLGAFDEAQAVFRSVLDRRPDDETARRALGRIARLRGRPEKPAPAAGESGCATGAPAAPSPRTGTVQGTASLTGEGAFNEGRRLFLEGRFEEAIPFFARSLRDEVEVYASRFHLADCKLKSVRDLPEVCELLEACIAMKPDQLPPYLRLALAWGARGDGSRQIEVLERCLAVDPDAAEAHFHLALAHDRLDHSQESFHHAMEAIRLDPGYRDRFPGLLRNSNVVRKISSVLEGALDRVHLSDEEVEDTVAKITEILGAENVRVDLGSGESREKVRRLVADESRLELLRTAFRERDPEKLHDVLADSEIEVDVEGAAKRLRELGATTF